VKARKNMRLENIPLQRVFTRLHYLHKTSIVR
jgi:hypothetical protein